MTAKQPATAAGRRYPSGEPDLRDPAWHQDDSYGGCTVCVWTPPWTEDEYIRAPYPCAVVREAEAAAQERERIAALFAELGVDPRLIEVVRYVTSIEPILDAEPARANDKEVQP